MKPDKLYTKRLILIQISYKMAQVVLHGDRKEIEGLGFKTNGKWPREDTLDILHLVQDKLKDNDNNIGYYIWMIVKKDDMSIIGDAGFKGEPDENGEIEIGYGLIEEERRKGYGSEAVTKLISWAFSQNGVQAVKAECLINNIGSVMVLQKCGMSEIKKDDEMIYWEIKKYGVPN